ncbi:MAG: hypothetical protein ACYSYV_11300 [Planctomycetota bacterium]|jgi:hypothetical protein
MSDFIGTMKALDAAAEGLLKDTELYHDDAVSREEVNDVIAYNGVSIELSCVGQSTTHLTYKLCFVWFKDDPYNVDILVEGYFTVEKSSLELGAFSWTVAEYKAREGHRLDEWLVEWKIAA